MIDCKECVEYAHSVLARGEITSEDVSKLALDRHILKGCATPIINDPHVIKLQETTPEFRKGFISAMRCINDMGKGDHSLKSLLGVVGSILILHDGKGFFPND